MLQQLSKRAGTSLRNGIAYEKSVSDSLSTLTYHGKPIVVCSTTAGASGESDVRFSIDGSSYSIEVKDKKAFEGGQKRMVPGVNGLIIPEDCLHKECLGSYIPFQGNVPSFLKGDRRPEQWASEKHLFADEYIPVDKQKVTEYYRRKGESYIQVEDKGLYHLGTDILGLGVPEFQCETKLRIRCKCHSSEPMVRSIMTSFYYDKKTLMRSPYDLITNPPPAFTKLAGESGFQKMF
jgi:hypothetical protein